MLNKYRGPIDESYKTVSSCLKKFADSAHTDLARKKSLGSGLKPAWNVPFSRNVRFVGRDAQLHQLKNFLFARDQPGKIAIWGLGGIGKTQIALQLAYHTRDKYSDCSVLWMSAISAEGLEQAFVEVGQQLKVPGIEEKQANAKRLVKDYLGNARAGRWLLIVDNIDDMDIWKYVLKDYLPESPQGCVVCTSRSKKVVVEISASSVVEVPQMEEEMAMQLLRKLLIDSELLSHEQDARDLLHELTFLPLAIVQASAYINANSNTLSEYVSLIRGQEQDMITVLSQDFGDDQRYEDVKNPVATTWLISFQQIQRTDPLAADYLSLLSCVVSKDIPLSILPLPSEVEPPKVQKSIAIGTLAAYSFVVKRPANDTIDIHRLVQLAARSWLKAENQWHVWVDKTIQRLVEIVPFGGHEKRELWTPYLPHAIQTTGLSENGAVEGWMFLMERIGHCERLLGHYRTAEGIHSQLLRRKQKALGEEHPSTLASMHEMGVALGDQGKYSEAEKMHQETLALKETALGKEHPETLASMHNLACTLGNQGKYAEAEKMHRETLALTETALGKEHPSTLASMHEVGVALGNQGKYAEAEKMHRETLALKETALGKEHPSTLTSMGNLAQTLGHQRKYAKAEKMHRETLALKETALGKEHPSTLTSMGNLAQTLDHQGKYAKAEKMHRETLALKETALGKEHPETLASMNNLACTLGNQGKYAEAEKMHRETLALTETALGKEHPSTLVSMNNLAWTLGDQGKYTEAEKLNQEIMTLEEGLDNT
jgi:tetratricopeptide (TPR) repeat protein